MYQGALGAEMAHFYETVKKKQSRLICYVFVSIQKLLALLNSPRGHDMLSVIWVEHWFEFWGWGAVARFLAG